MLVDDKFPMDTVGTNRTGANAKVAVVDDDPRIRRLLEDELIDLGYATTCYSNAFDLLNELDTNPPTILLLDLLMPQMDGIECLRRVRSAGFEGPVIIFTALSDNEKRREADLEGATEYILKPDLFEHLETIISKYL
jgi:DNA-binding response OmpR family regulator